MHVKYRVTTEMRTPWWVRLLRFFRLKAKREEFELVLESDVFKKGDRLNLGSDVIVLILKEIWIEF